MKTHYTTRWRLYCQDTNTPLDAGSSHNIRFAGWSRRMQLNVQQALGLPCRHDVTDDMLADHLELGLVA